jgi:superfamily II DNA or RNA helicase
MVDFAKLRNERKQPVPTDPAGIFQRLPKPPHINDLWDSQAKALAAWNERRTEKDLVIKLNTGGGKPWSAS